MSDDQEVHCYHSNKDGNEESITIFFVQGFGSGIYSWTDFWDELSKEYNLVVLDPRDKASVKLKKNSKCSVQRIALDLVETIHYLKIKEENICFIGSSLGASYIAHCLSQGWLKPKVCFLIAPSIEPRNPKFLLKSTLMFPSFIVDKLGKYIGRKYLKNKVAEGFQRKVFYNRIENTDVRRWKHCLNMHNWNASEDFKKMNSKVYIITSSEDKYHELKSVEEVRDLIQDSQIVKVPSYDFMHIKPGVEEFVRLIKEILL